MPHALPAGSMCAMKRSIFDEDHEAFLESPFKEAAAAIHKRMHQLGMPH